MNDKGTLIDNTDGKAELPGAKPAPVPLCPPHIQHGLTDWPKTEPGPLQGHGGNWPHEPWPATKMSNLNYAAKGYQLMVNTSSFWSECGVFPKPDIDAQTFGIRPEFIWKKQGCNRHVACSKGRRMFFFPCQPDGHYTECLWSRRKINSELQHSASPSYKSRSTTRLTGRLRTYTDV
jgi:hypothetical protein